MSVTLHNQRPLRIKRSSASWPTVKFGDVVRNVNETERNPLEAGLDRYIGLEHIEPENLHIKSWGDLTIDDVSFTKRFRKGQVLFGKRRAYQRKVAVAEFDGICSSDILTFEPKDDALLPELLPFIVQSDGFFEHALGTSSGSLSPRTRWSQLQDYEFPLPPKDEQRRTAEMLLSVDRLVECYRTVSTSTDALLSVLTFEFLNKNWPMKSCSELFTVGPRNGLSPNCNAEERGFPTLGIGAIREGKVVAEGNTKFAEVSEADVEKFLLRPGDILVVRGNGNRRLCGKAGLVTDVPLNCFYPDLLIRLSFNSELIIPEFAVLQWNTTPVHSRLLKRAKSTNGIWKINGKDITQHSLVVPPLDEQKRFLEQLSHPLLCRTKVLTALASGERLRAHLINSEGWVAPDV